MSTFTDEYKKFLILQYADKPKARQTVEAWASEWESIYSFARSFVVEFDLDTAWGDRLDKIGKIVGQSRIIERGYAKRYFGFADTLNALTFGEGAFFSILRDSGYEATDLSDEQYRFFIRAKIAKNIVSATLSSKTGRTGLQDTVDFLFRSKAFVVDNKNMTMTVYIDESFDLNELNIIINENLLPTPQGVGLRAVRIYTDTGTFGFSNNPNSKTFGAGKFARLVNI